MPIFKKMSKNTKMQILNRINNKIDKLLLYKTNW